MAITVERMVAVLEARVDQFEKGVAAARAKAVGDFEAITTAGSKMEASIARIGVGGKKGFDNLNKSMTSLQGQTGNLAAQFNDIGVQLASGQSPFLIALQQGTQISQVLGPAGARGAVAALGGAFVSMINPVSLATIAAITLGGTVLQYFSNLISEGEKSEETLKAQAALIAGVADKWGEAYPAIKAYNDELKRTKDQSDLLAAIDIVKADQLKDIPALLEQVNLEMADFVSQLQLAGEEDEQIIDLQNAINAAADKMREGKDASGELNAAMGILKGGIENTANPAVLSMIELLGTLATVSQKTALAVSSIVPSTFPARPEFTTANDAPDARFRLPEDGPTPDERPNIELEGLPKVTGGSAATDQFKSATQSLEERTKALQAQYDAQSKLNPLINDYGYAVEFAKAKQELLNAAEKAKKEITPELAADIDKVSAAYARTSAELQKLAEENRKAAEAIQFQKDLVSGALSDMRTALEDGKLTWEDLGNVAVNVLNKIADKLQQMLVDQLFAQGFGGFFGSLGGLTGAVVGGVPGAAGAGGAGGAAAGLAKSAAPSLARAPRAPTASSLRAASQAQKLDVGVSVDDDGKILAMVRDESGRVLATSEAARREYVRNGLPGDVQRIMKSPRVKGR